METLWVLLLFSTFMLVLCSGFPVAFVLGGVGVFFALLGTVLTPFEFAEMAELRMVGFVANRMFDTLSSYSLIPISMFIFMGIMLDRSGIAQDLLSSMRRVLGGVPGGLAVAVVLIGVVLAASTGIVGASVVLLATISLPTMLGAGYSRTLSLGTVGATGCLGILVPPSIMLVVMGDQMRLPVGDLFMAALIPSLILATAYLSYLIIYAMVKPAAMPPMKIQNTQTAAALILDMARGLFAPLLLVLAVLGSILAGIASPTEASGIGAAGATFLAVGKGRFSWEMLKDVALQAGQTTAFLYMLIFGAACFSVVLRGYGGDDVIEGALLALPFNDYGLLAFIVLVVFLLGFFLDWMEIVLIIVPLVMPILLHAGFDPLWVAIMFAICLQTSFLTPPVGMALFYLKNAMPDIQLSDIYKGALPFVAIQLLVLLLIALVPELATWLPSNAG